MQATVFQSAPAEHVYHARWHRHYRWLLFILYPILGLYNLIDGFLTHSRWLFIIGIYFLVLLPLTLRSWRSIRLVITPDGVAYHSGGAVLTVPWHDMECIGPISQRWYRGWEGVIPRTADWKSPRWLPWPNRWRPPFIPLWSRWHGPWWDRELFDDLFFYAPWLADNGSGPRGGQRNDV
jgi:hypothetical protein